jgi:26S proteasome non-ATPase regulatory subunit 5
MDIFTIILATKGADLVLSTSPPAARHVVASAFDRNAHGKQLAALHALANIAGETRPKSNRIVDGKAEESLRCLIYDAAAQSTKLTPSGLFLSVLQQSSEIRLAGYRTLTALVARPWCLVEILAKEEIINIVTDATTETAKIAMEARYNCCKAIHEAFLCSNFVDDPRRLKTGDKVPYFSSALFKMEVSKRLFFDVVLLLADDMFDICCSCKKLFEVDHICRRSTEAHDQK